MKNSKNKRERRVFWRGETRERERSEEICFLDYFSLHTGLIYRKNGRDQTREIK